jgi:hypothetical protein
MNDEHQYLFVNRRLPARLTPEETALLLAFPEKHIAILTRAGLLRPLGRPPLNGVKWFATVEILKLSQDREWLDKATRAVIKSIQEKNRKAQKAASALAA